MSRSTDPGHFFQTDASEIIRARRAAKSGNNYGNPIKLQSKILDIVIDPIFFTCVFVAESAGNVKRVNIDRRDVTHVFTGPLAPLTSVAIGGAEGHGTVFAGCWDKDIWSWNTDTRKIIRKYKGHSDFVKAVVCTRISGIPCLISGGADKKIMVWNTMTGDRLHTLRDKSDTMLSLQCLAIDPVQSNTRESFLFSGSSDPKIRRWRIALSAASQLTDEADEKDDLVVPRDAIAEHETSVYKLQFDEDEGNLWTASADGTAKCLSRYRDFKTEETYEHGDYVRAVAVTLDWVVTAGRDEDIKVWDRNSGKLFHTYEGHYEEVTGLLLRNSDREIISVSIDGTIRTWSLLRGELEKSIKEKEDRAKNVVKEEPPPEKKSLMTADEEAELAELMDDSE